MNPPRDALGDFFRATVRGARYAAADGFSEDEKVGRKFPRSCASARASADGVGFIGDEQRAVAPGERLRGLPVAVFRQDDPDVGHGRFGQNASNVVVSQGVLERGNIVELDDTRGFRGIYRRTEVAASWSDAAVGLQRGERFVHRAVVAIMENKDLAAPGDFAGYTNGETVGV